ncbi:spinster family MFS transporter [Sphingopyxis sp. NJF-3]
MISANEAPQANLLRWYVLAIMSLVYAINIADRYVVSTVLESIRLELHFSDASVAFLTGSSLAIFYVAVSIPVAMLADRHSRRTIVAASLFFWSLMTLLCGFVRNSWHLVLARIGVGIGESGATPASAALISDYFRPFERPMAMTFFTLGAPLGAWLGSDIAGRVADLHGWRMAFIVLGLPGMLLAMLIMLTVREPRRAVYDGPDAATEPVTLRETLSTLWHNKPALHLMAAGAVTALWGWGLLWWAPTYFIRAFGMTSGDIGVSLGAAHLVAGAGVTLFASWVMSWERMRKPRTILLAMSVVVAVSTVPSLLMPLASSRGAALILLWTFLPAIYFYIGPSIGLLQNAVPVPMRAQATAISVLMGNITNLVIAPVLVGVLSDMFGGDAGVSAQSLRWALVLLALTGFWAAYHFWAAARGFNPKPQATGRG